MTDIKVSNWISDVGNVLNNPTAIQRLSLQRLKDITNGKVDVPDATSPFAYVLENSAINTAAFIEADIIQTRRQYPSVAQTENDLYLHMSDKDYLDRFATPAKADFFVMIEEGALNRAFVVDAVSGESKLTIPRNTEFSIDNVIFSIQYPIEIKKLASGSYQINYIVDKVSPLLTLTTNSVEADKFEAAKGVHFVRLKIPAEQFFIKSVQQAISSAQVFKQTYQYEDSFYYARVYYKNTATGNSWREIRITHTDQVYDPNIITAVLKVLPGELEVFIPQIYFSTGLLSGNLRVDIYQTKGEVNLTLANYSFDNFTAQWRAIDKQEITPEVARFSNISEISIYSQSVVNSGTKALSFLDLRSRVINSTVGMRDLPITNIEIEDSLKSNGFNIVKHIDVVTGRTFLATRDLIKPFDERLVTAAATSTQTLITTMVDVGKHPAVFNNGLRVTLTPDILYRIVNGQMEIVSANKVIELLTLPSDEKTSKINSEQYVYSPFHYVLDGTTNNFSLRPYFMDAPKADIKQFIDNNESTLLEANTDIYSLDRTDFGYRLTVQMHGNDALRDLDPTRVFAQLRFVPKGETSGAYLNGQLVGLTQESDFIFIFDINTDFDIDIDDNIHLTSFRMANLVSNKLPSNLNQVFSLVYGTFDKINIDYQPHSIDSHLGQFLLDETGYAITEETFKLSFGVGLKNLWASSKSYPSVRNYKRYTNDVPSLYTEDVFEVDPVTGSIFKLDSNNDIVYNYKHRKGDQVYSVDGLPLMLHKVGDIVYDDVTKLPIPESQMDVARHMDIVVVEGAYYFATDPSSSTYKQAFVSAMVDWIVDDISELQKRTLDKTYMYFYPKTNLGSLEIVNDNGYPVNVKASQSFIVNVFLRDSSQNSIEFKNSLTRLIIEMIDIELKKDIVSISNIESNLLKIYGLDVAGVEITGLGGIANYQIISNKTIGERLSIRKRLTAQSDGKLIVEEDVTINLIQKKTV